MDNQDEQDRAGSGKEVNERTVDPGAAPGVSDAGSVGHLMGTGLAGAGTGTSIGPSRGNTGPGTGSDDQEAAYGRDPETRFSEMVGVGPERPGGDEGGNRPLTPEEHAARVGQAATPEAELALEDAQLGNSAPITSNRGLGDDDIPVETEIE